MMNVNHRIESLINLSLQKFSYNKKIITNQTKCARDLRYILEAIFEDIKHDTTVFTNRIANKFWYNGKRQLKNYDIEIKVYNDILAEIENVITYDEYQKAKRSIELLIEILSTGPQTLEIGTKLVYDALKAEHCQRNWDADYNIPDTDLDALIKVATTMPTKQNRDYYKLIVSTDKEFNEMAYNFAIEPNNPYTFKRNSQVNANALFIYIQNLNFETLSHPYIDNHDNNTTLSIGISSGGLAFAATQLDYRVGFCQCYLQDNIKKELLKKNINVGDNEHIKLLVGVGKPMSNYNWNQVVVNNTVLQNVVTYPKNIKVFKI